MNETSMVALANDVGKGLGALPDDSARYDMVKGVVGDAEVVFAGLAGPISKERRRL